MNVIENFHWRKRVFWFIHTPSMIQVHVTLRSFYINVVVNAKIALITCISIDRRISDIYMYVVMYQNDILCFTMLLAMQ